MKIKLNSDGMAEMLKRSETANALADIAADMIKDIDDDDAIKRHDDEVEVYGTPYETDRATVQVTLESVIGARIEGKYGVLRAAARAQGLDVSEPKGSGA